MKKFIIFVSLPMKLETLLFVIDCLKTKFATSSLFPKPKVNGGYGISMGGSTQADGAALLITQYFY